MTQNIGDSSNAPIIEAETVSNPKENVVAFIEIFTWWEILFAE